MLDNRILVLLTVCFLTGTAYAQKPQIGLMGGLNISSMHFSPPPSAYSTEVKVNSKAGIMLGGLFDVPIAKNSYIEAGLVYDMKGLKLSGQELELRYTYHYLDIPVYFKYRYKGIFAAAGPYLGLAVGGKVKVISVDTSLSEKIPIGSDPDSDGIKRLDMGINIKAGYELPVGVFFSLQYGFGFANVEPALHTIEHHNVFTVGIGYFIKPKRNSSMPVVKPSL